MLESEGQHSDKYFQEGAFTLAIFNFNSRMPLRDMSMGHLGHFKEICGTVTRTTETKPELLVGVFSCNICGAAITAVEQEFK